MQLSATNVGKQWSGDTWGVRDVSFALDGGIVGLLGPNGAGKSTILQLLATVTKPSAGTVRWNGTDVAENPGAVRSVLGYLPQDFGVYPSLTPVEFLEYIAALKGIPRETARSRIERLLEVTNLAADRDRPIGTFSGGTRQRVGIAQALLNDPELLIVDEPTVGLDPEERVRFRNVIGDLTETRLVILSTHIVGDIEATASELMVLNDGQLVTQTAPETLIEAVEGMVWEWTVPGDQLPAIRSNHTTTKTVQRSDGVLVRAVSPEPPTDEATPAEPTLEDAYLWRISDA